MSDSNEDRELDEVRSKESVARSWNGSLPKYMQGLQPAGDASEQHNRSADMHMTLSPVNEDEGSNAIESKSSPLARGQYPKRSGTDGSD